MEEQTPEQEEISRTRIPQRGEVLGLVLSMLGAGRMSVECEDGFKRICRIPGKLRRRMWVRMNDIILIKPWTVQTNERADIIWKYTRNQVSWLKRKGYIKKLSVE